MAPTWKINFNINYKIYHFQVNTLSRSVWPKKHFDLAKFVGADDWVGHVIALFAKMFSNWVPSIFNGNFRLFHKLWTDPVVSTGNLWTGKNIFIISIFSTYSAIRQSSVAPTSTACSTVSRCSSSLFCKLKFLIFFLKILIKFTSKQCWFPHQQFASWCRPHSRPTNASVSSWSRTFLRRQKSKKDWK